MKIINRGTIYQMMCKFWNSNEKIRITMNFLSWKVSMFLLQKNLFMSSSKSMDPKEIFLLQCNGLELNYPDITIRYLAVKDIMNDNIENGEGLRLYKKFISGVGRDSNKFTNNFFDLVRSFADHGYNSDFCLTLDRKMQMMDGSHRLSCALFFGVKTIYIRNNILYWDRKPIWEDLINAGFCDEEIDLIRHESDLLIEDIIKCQEKEEKILDQEVLRKWISKKYKKVCKFDKQKLNRNSFMSANNDSYYQSLPMLGICGIRSTDKRIEQYCLKEILKTNMDVLDIGCNIGFMDIEIASLVRNVTGIEFNPVASRLAKSIACKLNIRNTTFYDTDFKEWKNLSRRKYDLILSLEVHQYINLSPQDYAAKIASLIKPCGFVLFESHIAEEHNDYNNYIDAFINYRFQKITSGYSKDQGSENRIWTLLQQKDIQI